MIPIFPFTILAWKMHGKNPFQFFWHEKCMGKIRSNFSGMKNAWEKSIWEWFSIAVDNLWITQFCWESFSTGVDILWITAFWCKWFSIGVDNLWVTVLANIWNRNCCNHTLPIIVNNNYPLIELYTPIYQFCQYICTQFCICI
jgi:hypothetical protein